MQAIVTKYAGPTNARGSRVIATADAKRMIVPWDYALGIEENHIAAARTLATKLGWLSGRYPYLASGSLPKNAGYAHVFVREAVKS